MTMHGPDSGWLIVDASGVILSADARAAALLDAPRAEALVGRSWSSLVSRGDGAAFAQAREAQAAGHSWRGTLEFIFTSQPVRLEVALTPADGATAEDGAAIVRLDAIATAPSPAHAEDDDAALELAAMHGAAQAASPQEAARAVLQAVAGGGLFDWAIALRFEGDGAGHGAEVLAVYPAPLAGIDRGIRWSPLDGAERAVLESGEPALDGDMVRSAEETSPLARVPGFGMRSRLHIPIYDGATVAGCVIAYSASRHAFRVEDGVRLDRLVRPLARGLAATPQPPDARPAAARQPEPPPPIAVEPVVAPPVTPDTTSQPDRPTEQLERLGALGELVAGVAHELNNPLTAILGYAQILRSLDGAEQDEALATIERESMRASRIVRNLLAFARQQRPRVQAVDIEAVIRRVLEVRRYSLEVDNVRVVTHFAGVPELAVDEYQMEQVILHLVNNAHQALLRGRGEAAGRTAAATPSRSGGTVTISTEVVADAVRIVVADDGPGVPPELLTRIFEPFYTTSEEVSGRGMGLAIVYGIVTERGGRVWVESVEDGERGGARFIVELPLTPAKSTTAPARPAGGRILIVDDEPAIRALTREILSAAGYTVDAAGGGEEALTLIEQSSYDLVVSDVRMPGVDGTELFERASGLRPELRERFIFITGDIENERVAALRQLHGVHHLEKPFGTAELIEAVRAALAD